MEEAVDQYSYENQQRSAGAGSRLNQSNISEGGFRQNILDRLGNAHLEDSAVNSQPDDMYSGAFASGGKDAPLVMSNKPKPRGEFVSEDEYSEF